MAKKYIYVMPTDLAGDRAVISEAHPAHPTTAEIFIRGYSDVKKRKATRVGITPAIKVGIHNGVLVETNRAGKVPKAAVIDGGKGEGEGEGE